MIMNRDRDTGKRNCKFVFMKYNEFYRRTYGGNLMGK